MEDWLNLELLRTDGVPLVCVNGALDKVCSGYYSNFLNPKLGECAARFFDRFDQAYYLKPIGSGRGWLFRVYGEPWQLFRQTREDLELAETYEARPTPAECVEADKVAERHVRQPAVLRDRRHVLLHVAVVVRGTCESSIDMSIGPKAETGKAAIEGGGGGTRGGEADDAVHAS